MQTRKQKSEVMKKTFGLALAIGVSRKSGAIYRTHTDSAVVKPAALASDVMIRWFEARGNQVASAGPKGRVSFCSNFNLLKVIRALSTSQKANEKSGHFGSSIFSSMATDGGGRKHKTYGLRETVNLGKTDKLS